MIDADDFLYHCALDELRAHVAQRARGEKRAMSDDDLGFWIAAWWPTRLPLRDGWTARGKCTGVHTDLFYPEQGDSAREAQQVCTECPVMLECLQWSLEASEVYGIWGGTSQLSRKTLRRAVAALDAEVAA